MNGTIRYTIRPYDTIWMLAQVFNTTVDSIMELNPGIEPRDLQVGQVITLRPGLQYYPSYGETEGEGDAMDADPDDLNSYFRMLWDQHAFWTWMTVLAIDHNLPETDQIINRLLRNPMDFANAFEPFYGEEIAKAFEDLFTVHLTIAAELVKAAKAGDNNAMMDADKRWHDNAEQIAELLGSINPYWTVEDWSAMLNEHLDILSTNVASQLAGRYEEAINGFDDYQMQVLEMADMMAAGISEQFPG